MARLCPLGLAAIFLSVSATLGAETFGAPTNAIASGFANASLQTGSPEPPPVDPNAHGTEPMQGHESPAPKPKHFFTAAGEIVLLEALPWAIDRYVANEGFARISLHTVNENLKSGFHFDRDNFSVNQSSHPYHGSLFFEAGRSNGYNYWQSGLFAAAGSLVWEYGMENDRPSTNDLVNTTLGGMTRGEISHRISAIILDNTASGADRFWRELAAAVVNPVNALTRLLHGDMTRDFPNPEERYPNSFTISTDLGYRHVESNATHPNQGVFSFSALYGDPFGGDIQKPFDSFWVGFDLNSPGGTLVSRLEERGILKGWELTESSESARHIFGFAQEYEYLNNESQVVGAQMFSAGVLSRYRLGKLAAATDVSLLAIPLAGIKTTDFANPQTGRNYDYAPGGGARIAVRLFGGARELAAVGYGIAWTHTVNGVSKNNTLQFFRATARVPIWGPLGVGGGYWWYSRQTTYPGFFEARKTQSEWRGFLNLSFGGSELRKLTGTN